MRSITLLGVYKSSMTARSRPLLLGIPVYKLSDRWEPIPLGASAIESVCYTYCLARFPEFWLRYPSVCTAG